MSVPARKVSIPPAAHPDHAPRSPRLPHAPEGATPLDRIRSRRRPHPGFSAFAGIVVTAVIVGVVALNALLAQTAFQMRTAQARLDDLRREQIGLTDEAARLSSPVLVARWARRHEMVTPAPGAVHILRVPGTDR